MQRRTSTAYLQNSLSDAAATSSVQSILTEDEYPAHIDDSSSKLLLDAETLDESALPNGETLLAAPIAATLNIDQSEDALLNPDYILVGAGPNNLFLAIQLLLKEPKLRILILEKYLEFQRKHPLRLERESFANSHPDANFQAFLSSLPLHIRTSELQSELLNYAIKLGATVEYSHVTAKK